MIIMSWLGRKKTKKNNKKQKQTTTTKQKTKEKLNSKKKMKKSFEAGSHEVKSKKSFKVFPSRKLAYVILTPLNPTFI